MYISLFGWQALQGYFLRVMPPYKFLNTYQYKLLYKGVGCCPLTTPFISDMLKSSDFYQYLTFWCCEGTTPYGYSHNMLK